MSISLSTPQVSTAPSAGEALVARFEAAERARSGGVRDGGREFASFLGGSMRGKTPEETARLAAEEFVAAALVQPALTQLRETNAAAAPFAPGDAERAFAPILDAEIARRIVQRADYALVDEVARRLLGKPMSVPAAHRLRPQGIDEHA